MTRRNATATSQVQSDILKDKRIPAKDRIWAATQRHVDDRTLRLFACKCVREVWHLLTDERSRKAVEVAEPIYGRQVRQPREEQLAAWDATWDAAMAAAWDAAMAQQWPQHGDAAMAAAWDATMAAAMDKQIMILIQLTENQ